MSSYSQVKEAKMFNRYSSLSFGLVFCSVVLSLFAPGTRAGENSGSQTVFDRALENGRLANEGFWRSRLFVDEWLTHADPKTGLIPRNLSSGKDIWNAQDSAADNYPFMVLTAAITDKELFEGRMQEGVEIQLFAGEQKQLTVKKSMSRHVAAEIQPPSVRAITKGPKFHWFAYYDKLQFDPTGRYVLGMEVDFEGRSPRPDDVIRIGMVDLKADDKWIELGTSSAWGWQQGCMLQWRPGSRSEILYNDRLGDHYVCRILDVFTRKLRTVDYPIYSVSLNGKVAVSADFRRIQDMRPGYGYTGLADPHKDESSPKDSGIFLIDLDTGRSNLIISLAQIAKVPYEQNPQDAIAGKHYFNHLLFAPDGKRFIFLNRWRVKTAGGYSGFRTRMFTAAADGGDIRLIDGYGRTSHFIWRDPEHILAWAWHPSDGNKFYLYEDGTGKVDVVGKGVMTHNGHCTYLPGSEWILNDTYPSGANREQNIYLYHVAQNRKVHLGGFHSPKAYTGEWRCDTHPRFSPDGKIVCFDSPHGDNGRQMHLIDISKIVAEK